jgi:hypothetical protein
MPEYVWLALCGALGAALYGFPVFMAALNSVPPARFAWASLAFSIAVGALSTPLLVPTLGNRWPWLLVPEPYPLAIGIGLAVNPIAPILVRKLTGWVDAVNIGTTKK